MTLPQFTELRRSTRVPLEVTMSIEGESTPIEGTTVVVNLHGALIRTNRAFTVGSQFQITVYLTGKTARARVAHVSPENPLECGIELDRPQNIWGVSLIPDDWDEERLRQ
jgi:hypothetical protein